MTGHSSLVKFFACLAVLAFSLILAQAPAAAQIEPRRCGLLDGPGCNPNQCGILDGPGCLAQPQAGVSEDLRLTLRTGVVEADARMPSGELRTLQDLFTALRACWSPPAAENARRGMQMSMRFSLDREGRLIGAPRITYATRGVSRQTRDVYRDAIAQSLEVCTPLPFSKELGGAIAGRPIAIRIIDDRENVPAGKPPG